MLQKVKEWAYWAYEWVTIIGVLALEVIAELNLTELFAADNTTRMMALIATIKAIAAVIERHRTA